MIKEHKLEAVFKCDLGIIKRMGGYNYEFF